MAKRFLIELSRFTRSTKLVEVEAPGDADEAEDLDLGQIYFDHADDEGDWKPVERDIDEGTHRVVREIALKHED